MPYSYIQYTGNGTQTDFTFPFSYINQTDIIPSVGDVDLVVDGVDVSYLNASTIKITPAPAVGALVSISRRTGKVNPIVDFNDGSVLQSRDLDLLAKFALYTAQEADDQAGAGVNAGVSATLANLSKVSATASAASASASAATATTQAGMATTKAGEALASANAAAASAVLTAADVISTAADVVSIGGVAATIANGSLNTIANDLAGVGYAYDLGSIGDVATGVTTSGSGNIVTVASNIASVNTVATNIGAVVNAPTIAAATADSAATATTQAGIATTQAGNASTSATTATTQAGVATTQAGIATTQAGIATTQASNASTSATAAAAATVAAESARDATLSAYDNFDDRYLGAKASDPTLDNDGDALVGGSIYFNTSSGAMKVYTGSAWAAAYISAAGVLLNANNLSDINNFATARSNLGVPDGSGTSTGTNTGDQTLPTLASLGAQASLGFTPYNATNPSSFISQAGISALPLSQLASTLDMGTIP